ncbi:unnamed protein product [Eruca vesicaria subsp. sativa]|uniref:Phorbol-ester/DAG-type domain-containing protein n=1 Tax=Eruca vesicaria subsp. sativa TaxID=29727 RepID=A0ABC8IN11_ERUVS|nr:unnamed protein product [Eruca vesicaria subsp. sativa]
MFSRPIHDKHVFEDSHQYTYTDECYLCDKVVSLEESDAFYCQGCRFNFHKNCLTVNYPKCHEHTLTYIRGAIPFPCDVCGSKEYPAQMYGCLQCDFFVHRHCIYLPKVIKITRHSHRLGLAHRLLRISDGDNHNVCGICRRRVHVRYGGYSCIDNTCNYVVHSDCIMRFNVWDGKDVEGEPEEEEVDDLTPLLVKDIDGESIWRHFSHDHDLFRVLEDQDSEELCQACILPTKTGTFLRCKQCDDFALHETCASLPRKMSHGLHLHPLTLHLEPIYTFPGFFTCSVCNQYSSGLMSYKCSHKDCGFIMDVKCASFVEPFNHTALPHDPFYLGINLSSGFISYLCDGCRQFATVTARCVEKVTYFDFKCVNLPEVMKYKSDDHPLTLYYDENHDFEWCEICEEIIEKGLIFYTCHECTTTLHVDCFLGKYPYLKCGHRIKVNGFEVEIASNNGASRPTCQTCHRICQDKQVFNGKDELCFCSIKCIPFQASS